MQPKPSAIPAAAWLRGIGVPYEKAGHVRVPAPLIDDGVWGGVPLGGLGAGAMGRTYRGDFARWHLDIGKHVFQPLPANQFSVFVQQGDAKQAHVLAPLRPDVLKEWNWDMPVGAGTYHALFPKAWFVYEWDALPVRLTQKQFSPVIPHNYQESSYPVGVFEWTLENPTDAPMTVGLMLTWQNLLGHFWDGRDLQGGNYNFAANQNGFTGIVLARPFDKPTHAWDGTFAIAAEQQAGMTISYRTRFPLSDGAELWQDFASDGKLDNRNDTEPADEWESLAAGLAVTAELAPHESRTIPFTLAWDMPIAEFGAGTQWYKRYTKFYGTSGRAAWQIAIDALTHYKQWEAAIDAWQQPILNDTTKPDWYKTALFNELYYLVDGGTLWENGRVTPTPTLPRSQTTRTGEGDALPSPVGAVSNGREVEGEGIGRFAFLECYDYPFYNTFDVNFYSSFALALLWPELEKSIIRDFAATVPQSDPTQVTIEWSNKRASRKIAGALPHDLGGPPEDPLLRANYYKFQDINIWKDLNSKFVLQVWRDVVMFKDHTLAHDTWSAVVQALDYLQPFDSDGDGLLDHDGPDQTYDTWPMQGASAYGGSLWLAALAAAIELGKLEGDTKNVNRYTAWLAKGKASFEAKLWNGQYYLYDASGGTHADSIMADQLAGQWYADATGLAPIAPADHIRSALRTVFAYNVKKFGAGDMGAVNGMRPDSTVDTSSEQSQEVWAGTTYALAAFMLHRGLKDEAWATAYGVYNVTYNRGYWFRTPEAYDINNNFRASLYMRPLSIWAMEHAQCMTNR